MRGGCQVLLPDFVRALALARPVENLYMLRRGALKSEA